jgi:hypothetical protein
MISTGAALTRCPVGMNRNGANNVGCDKRAIASAGTPRAPNIKDRRVALGIAARPDCMR